MYLKAVENKLKYFLCVLFASVMITACNDDIFVGETAPDVREVQLDGDGGECTVGFRSDGLKRISTDYGQEFVTCFNRAGEEIPADSPFAEVHRIVISPSYMLLEILIDGDRMTFHCKECNLGRPVNVKVFLDYGFKTEEIKIHISEGSPREFVSLTYDMSRMEVTPYDRTEHGLMTYKNGLDHEWVFTYHPSNTFQCKLQMEPADAWARDMELDTEVPSQRDGVWGLYGVRRKVKMGVSTLYVADDLRDESATEVRVPVGGQAVVKCDAEYSMMTVPFVMVYRSPVSGREFSTEGICRIRRPESFKVTVEY